MKEALEFYWLALIVTVIFSVVVSYMGAHLVARKQSIVLIPQSQVTVISILIGILLFHEEENFAVIAFSFVMTLLSGIGLHVFNQKIKLVKAEWMLATYFILMAIGHSLTRFFPSLESHFHQSFQGDIVTADQESLYISLFFIVVLGVILIKRYRVDRADSFEIGIGKTVKNLGYQALTSLVLTLGVFLLGSAFTVGFLLIPSLLVSRFSKSYKEHLLYVFVLALINSTIGFLLSLEFTYLATIPTMILSLLITSIMLIAVKKSSL